MTHVKKKHHDESHIHGFRLSKNQDTLLHMDRKKIPTINQALLHRTAPPTTQASNQDRPAPPERIEHPT